VVRAAPYASIALWAAAFVGAAVLLLQGLAAPTESHWVVHASWPWLTVGPAEMELSFFVDPLGAVMLVVVTFVSLLVQIYSLGYMSDDPAIARFYGYLTLFTLSMVGLVLADNFVQLFICWELVGLCSYLLVGFWYHKPEAADAAKKAFLTTRFGDLGFLIGILVLYAFSGSFRFVDVDPGAMPPATLALAMVLLFCGAVGKSAQFPLHVWLPDAMEGPTPVSALIHAATMVAAGVYMVARLFDLFTAAPAAMEIVAWIGGFTALFAATHGLVMRDIKRVLAYSTVSQLGYMMMALGIGGLAAGVFHLTTHAFFKALLFLGAGSVIHGSGEQDLYRLGGLRREMPVTHWTFLAGSLALAGIFPFAGFWSKDEILVEALNHGRGALLVIGVVTAFLTSFYIFRAYFLTFWGERRGRWRDPDGRHGTDRVTLGVRDPEHHHAHAHAHESPPTMTVPLVLLAVLSVVSGWAAVSWFGTFVTGHEHHAELNLPLAVGTTGLALLGAGAAWAMYGRAAFARDPLVGLLGPLHTLFARRYYLDELYNWLIGVVVLGTSAVAALFDRRVVDGAVNFVGAATRAVGELFSRAQTGRAPNYALGVFGGIAIIVAVLLAQPGVA
jgi:NADH-quinone oxidoreductase subunit L